MNPGKCWGFLVLKNKKHKKSLHKQKKCLYLSKKGNYEKRVENKRAEIE